MLSKGLLSLHDSTRLAGGRLVCLVRASSRNQAAVANEGIRLNANGGSYYIFDGDGNLDRDAVNCITASATVVLLVTEWFN